MAKEHVSRERSNVHAVVSRPPSFQQLEPEASLARLQQMSELTGFQLAAAFSANGYNRYPVVTQAGTGPVTPVVLGHAPSLPPHEQGLRERWSYWNRSAQVMKPSWNHQAHHFQVSQAQEALKAWNCVQQQQKTPNQKTQPCQIQQLPASCQIQFQQPPSRPSVVRHERTLPCADLSLTLGTGSTSTATAPPTKNPATATATSASTSTSVQQFTMLYAGKIFVYDNMPANKAQAIMLLAGSIASGTADPINVATLNLLLSAANPSPPGSPLPPRSVSMSTQSATVLPQARKASLARFLERRKERSSPYPIKTSCAATPPPQSQQSTEAAGK